jgi:hypothetical protein
MPSDYCIAEVEKKALKGPELWVDISSFGKTVLSWSLDHLALRKAAGISQGM